MVLTSDLLRMRPQYFVCPSCNERRSEEHDVDWCEADIARDSAEQGAAMDDTRIKQLMDELSIDLMTEDLEHDCWVTLVWMLGRDSGDPEVAHGPYTSALDALVKADELRRQMADAPGKHLLAGYTPTFTIVPVYGDEKEDS